jgi:hypothetical protein
MLVRLLKKGNSNLETIIMQNVTASMEKYSGSYKERLNVESRL